MQIRSGVFKLLALKRSGLGFWPTL